MHFVPSLIEIGSVVFEKKMFKFHQCVFAISKLFPLGKGRGIQLKKMEKGAALHLNKLKFPSPRDVFSISLVEIGPVVLEKKMTM